MTQEISYDWSGFPGSWIESYKDEYTYIKQVLAVTGGKLDKGMLSFYPNPSSDYIQIETEISKLTVVNSKGAIVSQYNTNEARYDVSGLDAGIYIIKATNVDGTVYNSRLIKK